MTALRPKCAVILIATQWGDEPPPKRLASPDSSIIRESAGAVKGARAFSQKILTQWPATTKYMTRFARAKRVSYLPCAI